MSRAHDARRLGPCLVAFLLAGGCSSAPPKVNEYLLAGAPSSVRSTADLPTVTSPADLWLRVVRVRGFLDKPGIAWQAKDGRAGSYRYERWAEPLEEQVAQATTRALREVGGFGAVVGPEGPRIAGAYGLELHLEACHGDWSGSSPVGVVRLQVSLSPPDDEPILHEFERRTELSGEDPGDLVLALDASLAEAVAALAAWVGEQTSRP